MRLECSKIQMSCTHLFLELCHPKLSCGCGSGAQGDGHMDGVGMAMQMTKEV